MTANDTPLQTLIRAALAARKNAYVPYSGYAVGAALRVTASGRVFTGCNVENASYPAAICGERAALVSAISEGVRNFDTIVVATQNGGSPCGICRQMMYEFAPQLRVVCVDETGTIIIDSPLHDLLPYGFGPNSLPQE
ncbi:MAG: cytidine deaminase [Chloroflexota bacterium]